MHRSIAPAILLTAVAGAQQSLTLMTSPTSVAPMVFDEARDRAVEFTLLGEIFEYHRGVRLHRINLGPTAPGPRLSPGFVYDPARRRVLLFGGYSGSAVLADTWSWDGAAWTPMSSGPPGREDPGITFDSVRNRVVMYGGQQRFVGQLTDTWEHDGSQWIQRFPATTPTPNSPRLAFDLLRNVTVMISPSGFFGAPASTWEWNGTNWTQRNAGSSGPIGTNGEAIAYDPIRQRTVVAGGGSQTANNITIRPGQQIWEWDGSVWTQTATLNTTLRRYCWAWFDPTLGKVVVAGGPEPTGDTLELAFASWDGNTLQSTTLDAFPVSRFSFGWCSAPGGAVMFGGASGTSVYGDTWQWDGSGWQRLAPPTSPPARAEPAMAFDLLHATSVMFGGGGAGSQLGDFWSWNGATWTQLPAGPPARYGAAMAQDLARSEIVLFGGATSSLFTPGALRNDTWVWNGLVWLQRQPAHSPPPRHAPSMAYDLTAANTLLFGGRVGATAADQLDDTWQWTGVDWQLRTPVTRPPALLMPSAVYDWSRARVAVRGSHLVTNNNTEELWEWTGIDWRLRRSLPLGFVGTAPMTMSLPTSALVRFDGSHVLLYSDQPAEAAEYGPGCGAASLQVRARPHVGEPESGFELRGAPLQPCAFALDFGAGSSPLGGGCTLWLQGLANLWIATTDARGDAALPLAVPFDPQLRTIPLFAQAAVLDPSQPSGFAVTPALRLRVGD